MKRGDASGLRNLDGNGRPPEEIDRCARKRIIVVDIGDSCAKMRTGVAEGMAGVQATRKAAVRAARNNLRRRR